jgi:hypothetical protein
MVSLVILLGYLLLVNNTLTAYPCGDKHDNNGVSVSVSWRKYIIILNILILAM